MKIVDLTAFDIRFPTSRNLDGSDAMNDAPDYSAAYLVLDTDVPGLSGHGMTFTTGRGNELCVAAIEALAPLVVGRDLESLTDDLGAFWTSLVDDGQLRWVGPEKGVIHLATAAVVNAVWDLFAKSEEKPLWRLLADMSPEEVVRCVPFRYISDALTPDEAMAILREGQADRGERLERILEHGYPAYTTSVGWMGYTDDRVRELCQKGVAQGWRHFKLKVGRDLAEDIRRAAIVRQEIGDEGVLMIDANQVWDVDQAIEWVSSLAEFKPLWIEEPTNPDDVLGHARIARAVEPMGIGVATGEHCHNRVMFKQLFQSHAIRFAQIDPCRLGGINEALAVQLMAAKFGVAVCPHAGGVGLCEYVQHLSIFDYLAVSKTTEDRVTEYVDHLHEHFVDPAVVRHGHYLAPTAPGTSITMHPETIDGYSFPHGSQWEATLLEEA
ncbi:MAG: L-fuconate dehydratase [Acidimicrobiia bacterium]|jgi:L-fuconate dehydratase